MRALEFALTVFLSLMAAALLIDSLTLRHPALLEKLDIHFDLSLDSSLLWSVVISAVCGSVHAVTSTRASEGVPLMVLLLVLHTATYIYDAIEPPPLGKQRILAFAWRHGAATLLSLSLAFAYKIGRTVLKFTRWRRLLTRLERQAASGAEGSASTSQGPVLLLYANVGSGHKRAAEAVRGALLKRGTSPSDIVMLDAMELVPYGFRYVMQVCFQELTQSLAGQHILGFLYDAADHGRAKARFQRTVEDLCMLGMVEKVSELKPSAIVCTHFLPAQLFSGIRAHSAALRRGLPIAVVLTDLDLQYMWVHPVDHYFVPRDDAKRVLQAYQASGTEHLSHSGVTVSGIPIMPEFSAAAEDSRAPNARETRAKCLGMFGLKPLDADPRPVVLLVSSGKQLVLAAYRELLSCVNPVRLLVVMGRQADVRAELEAIPVPPRHCSVVHGFVTDMPSLYRCADLLVSKSGGLTIAEAAAVGLPMVILDPIPGQEQRNADVLLEARAAVKINDLPLLGARVDDILSGNKLAEMSTAIRGLGRPDAAFVVADAVLQKKLRSEAKPKTE